jgi:hypothetical protein
MYVSVILSQDTYSQSSYLRKFKCSVKLKLFYAYFTIIQSSNLFVSIQTLTHLNQTKKVLYKWHRVSSARQIKLVLKTMDNLNTQRPDETYLAPLLSRWQDVSCCFSYNIKFHETENALAFYRDK